MDKAVYLSLLLDFYGELLTEKQRQYAELYYNENLSLGEIAELDGISRQSVRDSLLRAEAALTHTEEKTGLVSRHKELMRNVRSAEAAVEKLEVQNEKLRSEEVGELCSELKRLLAEMKR